MKNYIKLQLGNNCPQCADNPCAILLEVSTGKMFEHCGVCRRSWNFTRRLTQRAADLRQRALEKHNKVSGASR